jgi:hypothetical protein
VPHSFRIVAIARTPLAGELHHWIVPPKAAALHTVVYMPKNLWQFDAAKLFRTACWLAAIWAGWMFLRPLIAPLAVSTFNASRSPSTETRFYNSPPDFMQFYFAGHLARTGRIAELYHPEAYGPLTEEMRARGEQVVCCYPRMIRPAFTAYLCVPFTWFSYRTASLLVTLSNIALIIVLAWKAPQWFSLGAWSRLGLFAFFPFLWSVAYGQETVLMTLLMAYSLHLAYRRHEIAAGVLLGLCSSKPHLICLLPLALLLSGKRRMLGAFIATSGVLGVVSFAAIGVNGFREWLAVLQAPYSDYLPQSMGNLRALSKTFGMGAAAAAMLVLLPCLLLILFKGSFHQRFSAMILGAILLSPHIYWQDYSLVGLVAAVVAYPAARFMLLIPWPYFYPRADMLPAVLMVLGYLMWMAGAVYRQSRVPADGWLVNEICKASQKARSDGDNRAISAV